MSEVGKAKQKERLPIAVELQDQRADRLIKGIQRQRELITSRGRPKSLKIPQGAVVFVGDSEQEVQQHIDSLQRILGKQKLGNKRLGRKLLYYDLYLHFLELQRLGVTLPKAGSLSKKACSHGLVEILHKHKLTTESKELLYKNSSNRQIIGNKLRRIFDRVTCEINTVQR
jgi:hypothetical protein